MRRGEIIRLEQSVEVSFPESTPPSVVVGWDFV